MKKRKYILPAALGLALAIASCSNNEEESTTGITPAQFNPAFLGSLAANQAGNIKDDEQRYEAKAVNEFSYKINGVEYQKSLSFIETYSYGLIALKDSDGNLGIYSMLFNKFIVEPQHYTNQNIMVLEETDSNDLVIEVQPDVDDANNKFFYDRYGNLLLDKAKDRKEFYSYGTKIINGEMYATLTCFDLNSYNNTTQYFKYDKYDLKIKEVAELPEEDSFKDYDGPSYNDSLFEVFHDLTPLGVNAQIIKSRTANSYIIQKKGALAKTITIGLNQSAAVVGKSIIIQTREPQAEDSEDYNLLMEELYTRRRQENYNKYKVTSKIYDVENDTFTDIDLDYYIYASSEYLIDDYTGKREFTCVDVVSLNKDFAQNEYSFRKAVINAKGEIVYSPQNISFDNLVSFGTKYVDLDNKVLYDREFNPITLLNDISDLTLDTKNFLIYGTINDKWGIIGSDGKVKAEFIYDSLKPLDNYDTNKYDEANKALDVRDNCIIASIGYDMNRRGDSADYYRVNVVTGERTYIGNNIKEASKVDDLYYFKIDNELHILNQAKELLVIKDVYDYEIAELIDEYTGASKVIITVYKINKYSVISETYYVVDVNDSRIDF